MIYLQITFCLLAIVSSVRLMPIAEETETTEWTHDDITTEEAAAATTWLAPESLSTKEEIAADASSSSPNNNNNNNNKGPATIPTTEEPFNAVTDHDEPTAVWSPSQTVEIRLHPQSLRTEESKGSQQEHPTVAPLASQEFPVGPQAQVTSSTLMPTPSVAPSEDDLFGRRMTMEPQTHGSFGGQTGRLRSRDSVGTALRRAVTGSPAVQRLQQSTTRMASSLPVSTSGRDKAGPPTGSRPGRKIVGFGSLSTLSNAQRVNSKTAAALRKESFFKNRQSGHSGHGGDTPADTHMEPSPQWLYGTSKDTRKTVESFRLSNNERLLVLGLRDKVMTTSTASTHEEEEMATTATASKPEEMVSTATTTFTTTTVDPPVNDATISVTTETEAAQSTTTRPTIPPQVDSAMQETNDVPAQTKDAAAARETKNDATPEIDHETSQHTHDKTEGQAAVTETTVHPETLSTSPAVSSSTEANPFTKHSASKAASAATAPIPLDVEGEPIKNLDNSPLDAGSSSKQELGVLSTGDDCFGADCHEEQETGLNMGQLDHGGFDQEAHRYLVEEKTHDGYIIGEFGVVSRSSDLRAVRYTAHPSIDPQLIQEMLRTFWLLKTGEKE